MRLLRTSKSLAALTPKSIIPVGSFRVSFLSVLDTLNDKDALDPQALYQTIFQEVAAVLQRDNLKREDLQKIIELNNSIRGVDADFARIAAELYVFDNQNFRDANGTTLAKLQPQWVDHHQVLPVTDFQLAEHY